MDAAGMNAAGVKLAPGLPGLASLGARSVGELLGTEGGLIEEARAEALGRGDGWTLVRVPLPGTPERAGAGLSRSPRGAGTGWVLVRRYDAARARDLWHARFTRPRSQSLAEREWNLLCHLRAAGVTAPEPLAVAWSRAGVFARRSCVVMRELEGARALDEWLRATPPGGARRRGLRALGQLLARLHRARVELPLRLGALAMLGAEERACTAEPPPDLGLAVRRIPEVAVADARGGRILTHPSSAHSEHLWSALLDSAIGAASEREALRVLRLASAEAWSRAERHDLARSCLARRARGTR